jgi:hypothetical protein
MCPQGIPDRNSVLKVAPTAPRRPDLVVPLTGDPVYDKVGDLIALSRVWFRSLNVAFTASDLVGAAGLLLKAERLAGDAAKRRAWEQREDIRPEGVQPEPPKQVPPAPGAGARRRSVAKKEG